MNEIFETLRDLPLLGLVPLLLLMVVGLLLWAVGFKILRAGFAAAGLLLGGVVGWILGDAFQLGVPAWGAALFLGLLFAAMGALTYRLAVAGALAIVFGFGAPLAVIAVHELQGGEVVDAATGPQNGPPAETDPDDPTGDPAGDPAGVEDRIDVWIQDWFEKQVRDRLPAGTEIDPAKLDQEEVRSLAEQFNLTEEFEQHIEQFRNFARRLIDGVQQSWARTPERIRPFLLAAAVLGALLGILVGAAVPKLSTTVVTSFTGSLIWLASLRVILERIVPGGADWLPESGRSWLAIWAVAAVIGLFVQWTIQRRRADKTSS